MKIKYILSTDKNRICVCVIKTNEALMIIKLVWDYFVPSVFRLMPVC
jgi:acetate kinase